MPCLLAVVGSSGGGGDSRQNRSTSRTNSDISCSKGKEKSEERCDNLSTANSAEVLHCRALDIDPCLLLPVDAFTRDCSESASGGGGEAAVAPTPTYAALLDSRGDLVAVGNGLHNYII